MKLKITTPENLPGERWKWIPGSAKKYQMSNFGRTRRINEKDGWKIIKPRLHFAEKSGRKKTPTIAQVEINLWGKRKMLTISRFVYFLFVKKFNVADRQIVIQYRDGNKHNCNATNLVKMSYAEFVMQGYAQGNRRAVNSFVRQSKPVSQYSAEGYFMASYPSAVEASEKTGIPRRYINRSAWSGCQKAGGFYWRYGK